MTIDHRFFTLVSQTIADLSSLVQVELVYQDARQLETKISGVGTLQQASSTELSFLHRGKYKKDLIQTQAGAVVLTPEFKDFLPEGAVGLLTKDPHWVYCILAQALFPKKDSSSFVHETAVIDPSATLGENCHIEAGAVLGKNVEVGAGTRIGAYAVLDEGVVIGQSCDIGAHVSVSHSLIGNKVRVLPGARLGQRGFGFAVSKEGFMDMPQLGRVLIEDDVEVGANSTIDRGAIEDTVIKRGTRIDNQVIIGHNVQAGPYAIFAGGAGIAGSTTLKAFSVIGGNVGIAGHLVVGEGAQIGGGSGIISDIAPGEKVMGYPAVPVNEFLRQKRTLSELVKTKKKEKNKDESRD